MTFDGLDTDHRANAAPGRAVHDRQKSEPDAAAQAEYLLDAEQDHIDLPLGPDGEVDWDTYYDDPKLWEKVNADIAARRVGEIPIIRRRSANGSVVSAMMLGIRDALEMGKPKQEIVVQRDDSGDPDRPDKGFHLDFDPEDPTNTRATVRPWAGPSSE
jgi:hypothetical protein